MLFGWFKKKAPVFEYPQPVPEPPREYPDDWEKRVGSWGEVERCHCGRGRRETSYCIQAGNAYGSSGMASGFGRGLQPSGYSSYVTEHNVCPKCGHSDKWSKRVERQEYEYSASRGTVRNERTVVWTPECCEVVDEP